ncbi:MAG: protein TolQ [Alphaproteobacteria bacterium]|nr:protein TolQ [Alphaproteobacteria bacterium]
MGSNIIETVNVAGGVPAVDFSILALFLHAHIVNKMVLILLFLASFWSWAIIIDKWVRLRRLAAQANEFEDAFWSGGSLDDLYDRIGPRPSDPLSSVFAAAMGEWRRSVSRGIANDGESRESLRDRIERVMEVAMLREMERIERYMVFLGSAGATAPFVGLFGTVWGIMNSFQAIAATKATGITVIAPGLAEALFATALGLVVAIPAVIAFNTFNAGIGRYGQRLEVFGAEFSAILSRQLDEKA